MFGVVLPAGSTGGYLRPPWGTKLLTVTVCTKALWRWLNESESTCRYRRMPVASVPSRWHCVIGDLGLISLASPNVVFYFTHLAAQAATHHTV